MLRQQAKTSVTRKINVTFFYVWHSILNDTNVFLLEKDNKYKHRNKMFFECVLLKFLFLPLIFNVLLFTLGL